MSFFLICVFSVVVGLLFFFKSLEHSLDISKLKQMTAKTSNVLTLDEMVLVPINASI